MISDPPSPAFLHDLDLLEQAGMALQSGQMESAAGLVAQMRPEIAGVSTIDSDRVTAPPPLLAWINAGVALLDAERDASLSSALLARLQALGEALSALAHPHEVETGHIRHVVAWGWINRGVAQHEIGAGENLREAVANFDYAIQLLKALSLENRKYRNDLAKVWMNRGVAQDTIGTGASLREAVANYDEAIRQCRELPLEVPENRYCLASVWMNRGNTQRTIGTSENLREAVANFDHAIHLLQALPLENRSYRRELAKAWMNRGVAQDTIGTGASLREAVANFDQAIRLFQTLPLDDPANLRDPAKVWMNRGLAQLTIGTDASLGEAVANFDQAIRLLQALPLDNPNYRHDLARSWMNRGTAPLTIRTGESLREAVANFDHAIRLLQALPLDNPNYRHDLARVWMNRGIAQLEITTSESLREAVANFDHAIELIQALPLDNPSYRDDLADAWMSRGNAQHKIGTGESLREAMANYDEAIRQRQQLPLENPDYRHGLAVAWMNRGIAQQTIGTGESLREAVVNFDQAIQTSAPLETRGDGWLDVPLLGRWHLVHLLNEHPRSADERDGMDPTDLAETGLRLLVSARAKGFLVFDHLFAPLLGAGLRCYLHRQQFVFAAELVGEFMDPEITAGAGCDLWAAYETMLPLLENLLINQRNAPEASAIAATLSRLIELKNRHFGGTVAALRLQAAYWQRAGEITRGLEVWQSFLKSQPLHAEALLGLADYHETMAENLDLATRRSQVEPHLLSSLEAAIRTLPASLAAGESEAFRLFAEAIAARFVRYRLPPLPTVEVLRSANGRIVRESIDRQFDALLLFAGKTEATKRLGEAAAARALSAGWLVEIFQAVLRPARARWEDTKGLIHYADGAQQAVTALTACFQEINRTAAAAADRASRLSLSIEAVQAQLLGLVDARKQLLEEKFPQADPATRARELDALLSAMLGSVRDILGNLAEADRSRGAALAQQALGEDYARLSDQEQNALGTALLILDLPDGERFAGVLAGVLLEELLHRSCFEPVRKQHLQQPERPAIGEDTDENGETLRHYLDGKKIKLTLGQFVGALEGAIYAPSARRHPAFGVFAQLVRQYRVIPRVESLASPPLNRRHPAILNQVLRTRNACTHAGTELPPREEIRATLANLTAPADGFIPTFLRATIRE